MDERRLRILKLSPRKFVVELPGGGDSGEMSEAEARGWARGFIRGVQWTKAQIKEPQGVDSTYSD